MDSIQRYAYCFAYDKMFEAASNNRLLEVYKDKNIGMFTFVTFMLALCCKDKLFDGDKIILEEYKNMINNLNLKTKEKTLTDDESKFLLSMLATQLINYNECSKETMNLYMNNYFFKGKRFFNSDELIIQNAYVLDFLNQMFNTNIKLKYDIPFGREPLFSFINNGNDITIKVVDSLYKKLQKKDNISQKKYYYLFVFQVYALLHEFCHYLQHEAIIKNKNHDEFERLEKEFIVNSNNPSFYSKFHDNFKLEREANEFAFKYLQSILKTVIPPNILKKSISKLLFAFNIVSFKKIIEVKFEQLLNDEYEKIEVASREDSNYTKWIYFTFSFRNLILSV